MKAILCERCRERTATVHATFIAAAHEIGSYHFCDPCYARAQGERGASYGMLPKTPAKPSAPLPIRNSFVKKPMGGRQPRKKDIPAGVWSRCDRCETLLPQKQLKDNFGICPRCQNYFPMTARERIDSLADSFQELDGGMMSVDVLNFVSTDTDRAKLTERRKATGQKDAVITGIGEIGGHRAGFGVLDFNFLGGSMGSVVGEKLARLIEHCTRESLPVIIISASAGARMHEGTFSLMQLAKTCAALKRHEQAGLGYISVLTNPTIGGVLAGFAGTGGVILAEPHALIGLSGARVETIPTELPPGFQTAEFLLERGLIDEIVPRRELKKRLVKHLDFMAVGKKPVKV